MATRNQRALAEAYALHSMLGGRVGGTGEVDPYAAAFAAMRTDRSGGGKFEPIEVAQPEEGGIKGAGKRILDLMLRGTYASANAFRSAAENADEQAEDGTPWGLALAGQIAGGVTPAGIAGSPDIQENWRAFGRGLSGEDKTTFSEVLGERWGNQGGTGRIMDAMGFEGNDNAELDLGTVPRALLGDRLGEDWGKTTVGEFDRGATGLALDVLADPTTWIPVGGAINAGGKALRAAGIIGRSGREVAEAAEATVKAERATSAAGSGAASARRDVQALREGGESLPAEPMPKIDLEGIQRSINWKPDNGAPNRMDNLLAELMRDNPVPEGVNAPRSRPGAAEFEARFVEENGGRLPLALPSAGNVPEAAELITARATGEALNDAIRQVPSYQYGQATREAGIDPLYRDVLGEAPITQRQVETTRTVEAVPETPAVPGFANVGEAIAANLERTISNSRISKGVGGRQTLGELVEKVKRYRAEGTPMAQRRAALINTILNEEGRKIMAENPGRAAIPGSPARVERFLKTVDEVGEAQMVSQRLSKPEQLLWIAKYDGILTPEDIRYLRQANSATNFSTRVKTVLGRKSPKGFDSWADFVAAVERGDIDDKDMAHIGQLLGARSGRGIVRRGNARIKEWEAAERRQVRAQTRESDRLKAERDAETLARDAARQTGNHVPGAPAKPASVMEQVVTAERQLDDLEAGGEMFAGAERLTPEQMADVLATLPEVIRKNIDDPAKWKFRTRQDVLRSMQQIRKGLGRYKNGWGRRPQYDQFRAMKRVAARVQETLFGKGRITDEAAFSAAKFDEMMPIMEASANMMRAAGVEPVISEGGKRIYLSLHDVLASLPRELVEKRVFTRAESIYVTKIMEAAEVYMEARRIAFESGPNAGMLVRDLSDDALKAAIAQAIKTPEKGSGGLSPLASLARGDHAIDDFAGAIIEAGPQLIQRYENNLVRASVRSGQDAAAVAGGSAADIRRALTDPNLSQGDVMAVVSRGNRTRTVNEGLKSRLVVDEQTADLARALEDSAVTEMVTRADQAFIAGAEAIERSTRIINSQRARAATLAVERATRQAEMSAQAARIAREADEARVAAAYDLDGSIGNAFNNGVMRMFYPTMSRISTSYGADVLQRMHHAGSNTFLTESMLFRRAMGEIHEWSKATFGANSNTVMQGGFRAMQEGTEVTDVAMRAAVEKMKPAVQRIFDNIAERNAITAEHLNTYLKQTGVKDEFLLDPTKPVADQWRAWENVTDPLDLMDRYHGALMHAYVPVYLGGDFSQRFGSRTAREGWTQITSSTGASELFKHIDSSLYYPKEIVQQLHVLDRAFMDGMKGSAPNSIFNRAFFRNVVDPVTQAWKTGLTIYRPGHHMRNMYGDMTLSFIAGMNNPKPYFDALNILRTRGNYRGLEGLESISVLNRNGIPGKPLGDARQVLRLGRYGDVTYDNIYRMAHREGLLLDYGTIEDTAFAAAARGQEAQRNIFDALREKSPFKGKIHDVAVAVSMYRDHNVRLSHFIDIMKKSKIKDINVAAREAANEVRRWHPDGSGATRFENQVMKRTFMFYSWIRKALPLVAATIVTKPGKTIMYPKAMYNAAVSMGLDPESMSNPFPTDQYFPDWLSGQMTGPIVGSAGEYFGINPGNPQMDVLNDYGTGEHAYRSAVSSLNPIARIPIELGTSTSLGTGGPINDKSDYVDSNIPIVNSVVNPLHAMNRSTTGLGAPQQNNVYYDADGVRRVNENAGFDTLGLINWLTGAGVNDQSKPNYIRQGEIQYRGG